MFGFIGSICSFVKKLFIPAVMIAGQVIAETPVKRTIERTGEIKSCSGGKNYNVNFSTSGYSDDHFINVEYIEGITNILRDIDKTRMIIEFSGTKFLEKFIVKLTIEPIFIIDDVDIRRLLNYNYTNNKLELQTTPASYSEVFEHADISMNTIDGCDVPVCLGVNTNNCNNPSGNIPIYDNKYITVTCIDCFVGFYTDVFFDMKIRWFKLESLSGGFKNMVLNGALVLDGKGNYAWSVGIDKILPIVKPTTIITFYIGPVPIRIWFEIPVEEKADFSIHTSAELEVGATMKWTLGDNYLSWDDKNHWQHHKSTPNFEWNPVLSVSGNLDAESSVSLSPTIILHVNDIYTFWLTIDPILYGNVIGSIEKKQVCGTLSYDVDLIIKSELHIDIPLIHTKLDKTWGPTIVYDSGEKPIGTKCIPVG